MIWLCLISFLGPPSQAQIIVFGDSFSDTGNTFLATWGMVPNPLYYDAGRFTNGPNWIECYALKAGVHPPMPSRSGGWNFAHGGAKVMTSDSLKPSLCDQVTEYTHANEFDLHVLWAGVNDVLTVDLTSSAREQKDLVKNAAAGVATNVQRLFDKGARRFLVLNLPPVGLTPIARATFSSDECRQLNALSIEFNRKLEQQLHVLQRKLPTIDIKEFDVHAFYCLAIAWPFVLGLPADFDATHSACPFAPRIPGPAIGAPNGDPANYLYYDGLHPTAMFHALLGNEVFRDCGGIPLSAIEASAVPKRGRP